MKLSELNESVDKKALKAELAKKLYSINRALELAEYPKTTKRGVFVGKGFQTEKEDTSSAIKKITDALTQLQVEYTISNDVISFVYKDAKFKFVKDSAQYYYDGTNHVYVFYALK